jgi:hypothetical protein
MFVTFVRDAGEDRLGAAERISFVFKRLRVFPDVRQGT